MTLQDLIEGLRKLDPTTIAPRGFHNPHSWRGVYAELAFEPTEGPVTVGEMLATAESALGQTYEGWKGGDYTMSSHTEVHIDYEGQYGGADMVELWFAALSAITPAPAPSLLVGSEKPIGRVSGTEVAATMRWLWPVMDRLMEGRVADWSDEDLLEAHCCDYVREKAFSLLTILAKTRAASGVSSPGGEAGGWISTEALPVLPADCPQEYWVAYSDGSVGQLFFAFEATMDENWQEDEPYTGWMFEDMGDGLNVYNGPQPLFYKEMESAPLAPAELLKGGRHAS